MWHRSDENALQIAPKSFLWLKKNENKWWRLKTLFSSFHRWSKCTISDHQCLPWVLAMRALLAYLCIYVCALLSLCEFVYGTPAQFKPLRVEKLRHRCAWLHGKETQTHPDIISLWSEASNAWINKSLFRIVFGEGIVPAVLPLGPWLELRESTLCNTPGGYEEQMSCLLPSSCRLKAAYTSQKMTSWKVEPQKLRELFCVSIFGRRLAVWKGLKGELICCRPSLLQPGEIHSQESAHRAPSGQWGNNSLWFFSVKTFSWYLKVGQVCQLQEDILQNTMCESFALVLPFCLNFTEVKQNYSQPS